MESHCKRVLRLRLRCAYLLDFTSRDCRPFVLRADLSDNTRRRLSIASSSRGRRNVVALVFFSNFHLEVSADVDSRIAVASIVSATQYPPLGSAKSRGWKEETCCQATKSIRVVESPAAAASAAGAALSRAQALQPLRNSMIFSSFTWAKLRRLPRRLFPRTLLRAIYRNYKVGRCWVQARKNTSFDHRLIKKKNVLLIFFIMIDDFIEMHLREKLKNIFCYVTSGLKLSILNLKRLCI